MTSSPMTLLWTSCLPCRYNYCSISSTAFSISSTGNGRFSQALLIPTNSFCLSKASRLWSRFMTIRTDFSTRSYVLNRPLHCSHSRLRWIASPISRESFTRDSVPPNNGHFILVPHWNIVIDVFYHSIQNAENQYVD